MESKNSRHWSEQCGSQKSHYERGRASVAFTVSASASPPESRCKQVDDSPLLSPFRRCELSKTHLFYGLEMLCLLLIYFFIATAIKKYLTDIRNERKKLIKASFSHLLPFFPSFFSKKTRLAFRSALPLMFLMGRG
jgi:hypothetical protein